MKEEKDQQEIQESRESNLNIAGYEINDEDFVRILKEGLNEMSDPKTSLISKITRFLEGEEDDISLTGEEREILLSN